VFIESPAGKAVPIQVDGDFAGELPVRCESLPGALTLIDPA
jgi:diacylglycerol kinase family enzyme